MELPKSILLYTFCVLL